MSAAKQAIVATRGKRIRIQSGSEGVWNYTVDFRAGNVMGQPSR